MSLKFFAPLSARAHGWLTDSMPPVLSDPRLAKVTYDSLEKAVEEGVKEDAKREKAFGQGTGEGAK